VTTQSRVNEAVKLTGQRYIKRKDNLIGLLRTGNGHPIVCVQADTKAHAVGLHEQPPRCRLQQAGSAKPDFRASEAT